MINLSKIKYIVSDFDGVMTDNKVLVSEEGIESVFCNRSDGLAVELLAKKGIKVLVISKERNKVVDIRCKKLGIEVYKGIDNKIDLFKKILKDKKLELDEVCYVGNEVNDLDCMKYAKISFAPADSNKKVIDIASFVTKAKGGEGVIREISELIL